MLSRGDGSIRHHAFRDIVARLRPGDLLVVNRTRVIPARLLGRRASGGRAEILLLRPLTGETWEALLRPSGRIKPGEEIAIGAGFSARVENPPGAADGLRRVRLLSGDPAADIERHGHVPLPPYIRRGDTPRDRERYQTVFARDPGSVAAPTAGLHFTPGILAELATRGVDLAEVVLHVGPATFLPVRTEDPALHRLPAESFEVPEAAADAVRRTRAHRGRVVAVGTTTTRALESAATEGGEVRPVAGETDLVIVPGFHFRVVDALLTNFHLPRSSLLLLVSAFGGVEAIRLAYREAIRAGYRFYSYGDAMLIE